MTYTRRKPHILIVDDIPTNVELLGAVLEKEYEIQFATSGEEALAVAARTPPQLILLDIMMPDMDGYETCRRLRANPQLADIPVIFVTALEQAEAEIEGLALGAEDYIVKPFNIELTRLRVRNLLERRRNQARLALALHCANEGLWEWDLSNNQVDFDTQWAQPLGYASGEMSPSTFDWQSIVHPDDMHQILAAAADLESDISLEIRLRNREDSWAWMQLIGKVSERNDRGQPRRIAGAYLDIHRRKQAEEKLLERERRLAVLLDSLQDNLLVLDTSGTIVSQHFGGDANHFAPPAALGHVYSEIFQKTIVQQLDCAIANVVMTLSASHFECAITQNQHVSHFKVTVSALADSSSQPTGFMILARDISDIKTAQEEIRQLAFIDPLTKLPNRRLLMERLQKALLDYRRHGNFGALIFIDLDNFKLVNDRCGHEGGDALLAQVANRLKTSVRANDTVSRLGGDEFVVLLENLGSEMLAAHQRAHKLADSMLLNFQAPFLLGSIEHTATPSIGVTIFDADTENPESLLRQADIAMYAAKNSGKNQICFTPSAAATDTQPIDP